MRIIRSSQAASLPMPRDPLVALNRWFIANLRRLGPWPGEEWRCSAKQEPTPQKGGGPDGVLCGVDGGATGRLPAASAARRG